MYHALEPLVLVTYASDLVNNLAVTTTGMIAVARAGCVNVVPIDESSFRRAKYISCAGHGAVQRDIVMQCSWLEINGLEHLVILSTMGLQIYDANGSEILYSNPCQDAKKNLGFAQGVAYVEDMLFVGNNLGYIKMFSICSGYDLRATEVSTTHAHDAAVVWISASDKGIMVSSAMNKTICIFDISLQKFKLIYCLLPSAVCMNIQIMDKMIVLCQDDGTIDMYDISQILSEPSRPPTKMSQTRGHQSPIMGVDIAGNKLLTVSRDGCIKLWEIERQKYKLTLLFEDKLNGVPCGAGFTNSMATSFCVAASNTNIVQSFYLANCPASPNSFFV